MSYKVHIDGLERILSKGLLSQEEWDKIKREAAMEQHREIMQRARGADESPQVTWDYSKDWRKASLPNGRPFGSDYDYWNYVVDDAFEMWAQYAPTIPNDFIAESIAREAKGWSNTFYAEGFGVWQNGAEVSRGTPLHGPRVDVGPTADFSAFLERWNYSKTRNAGLVPLKFTTMGVLNFMTITLAQRYRGIHTVFMMPIKPNSKSSIRQIDGRTRPVGILPIIRIVPRYYRKA